MVNCAKRTVRAQFAAKLRQCPRIQPKFTQGGMIAGRRATGPAPQPLPIVHAPHAWRKFLLTTIHCQR
jgi:hypothetical protein